MRTASRATDTPRRRAARAIWEKQAVGHTGRQDARAIGHGSDGPDEILERGILQGKSGDTDVHELGDFLVHRM
jgi:hypothetical protein